MPTQSLSEPETVLRVDQLEIWRGEQRLLNGVSFAARPGELIHLKGPNGSGKTSLLRCLAGLSLPDAGTIHWFGRAYAHRVGAEARARCRYVGHLDALKGGLDVRENLSALQALDGSDGDIDAALAAVGLSHRTDVLAQRLSAGQKRRAALARLLLAPADAWLLDEPFTALDASAVVMVGECIARHLARGGVAVMTTHQPLPAALAATEITLEAAA